VKRPSFLRSDKTKYIKGVFGLKSSAAKH